MKWCFSGLSLRPKGETAGSSLHRSEAHTSLALNTLYHRLRGERKYNVLDLGPAQGTNVDFFSQFSCKIYIEDLYRTLTSFDFFSPEDSFSYRAVFDYLLPYSPNTRFDVVMTWDIFNYLKRDEYKYLMRHLSQFCRPSTLLFALISTLRYIPEKPITFKILDQERLLYQTNSSVFRPCPQYQYTDFNELMPNFRVCNSFLLRNGFKEYLFVRG